MRRYDARPSGWFAFGVRLFAVSLALGALVAVSAPVEFMRWLGAAALVGSVLGLALSLAGVRLEARGRWRSLDEPASRPRSLRPRP